MTRSKIMVVDDCALRRKTIFRALETIYNVVQTHYKEIDYKLSEVEPDLVLVGTVNKSENLGMDIARYIHNQFPTLSVVFLASRRSEKLVLTALHAGLNHYLRHPLQARDLMRCVSRCLKGRSISGRNRKQTEVADDPPRLIGQSASMRHIREYITRVARSDSTVLIIGETGTGKELVAEGIHSASKRSAKPMVRVNCAAIPDTLLESELFGHEKGAFTGAERERDGAMASAEGSILFLDEIGDMSQLAQSKVLRVVEHGAIQRLGSSKTLPVDVRIIAATNRDLDKCVENGSFRLDLYYRLNVAQIKLPPLREHPDDISDLLAYHGNRLKRRFGVEWTGFDSDALEALCLYHWPGNVRELINLIESILINTPTDPVTLEMLDERFKQSGDKIKDNVQDEKTRLLSALLATNWNKSRAAERLRWSRMTIYRKIRKYGLTQPSRRNCHI